VAAVANAGTDGDVVDVSDDWRDILHAYVALSLPLQLVVVVVVVVVEIGLVNKL